MVVVSGLQEDVPCGEEEQLLDLKSGDLDYSSLSFLTVYMALDDSFTIVAPVCSTKEGLVIHPPSTRQGGGKEV